MLFEDTSEKMEKLILKTAIKIYKRDYEEESDDGSEEFELSSDDDSSDEDDDSDEAEFEDDIKPRFKKQEKSMNKRNLSSSSDVHGLR